MKLTRASGGTFHLVNMQPQIQKVFDMVRLVPVNQIFASVQELDTYLDRLQREG